MCDMGIHVLLSKGARKYTRLPSLQELIVCMSDTFNQIMRENIYEANLSRKSYEMLEARKKKLRYALKTCAVGDTLAKQYVKDMIQDILIEKYRVSERNINELICFEQDEKMSVWDKFQILLHVFEKSYGKEALTELLLQGGFEKRRIIRDEDICFLYHQYRPALNFIEKLEIVTQRIYCLYKGLGIADDIREMNIDGVSGGVSGTSGENKTLWIFWRGRSVNLAFLKFGSERELERICNNIYRHNRPGHLSRSRGYIVNDMFDHSRVVVARPPFCESWVFFVRKFNKSSKSRLKDLYNQENHELIERFLPYLVKGCQNCAITGSQGSGKTTLLMALIEYINPDFNLRVQELAFELHLRDIYPERNIVTFRETDSISGQEGLDLQKKTDGSVNILGEVATAPVAGWMIQMGLTASVFTMFTHHAGTTQSLVSAMANALLSENIYQDEQAARRQVTEVIRFDIHVGMDGEGNRRIERINEIVTEEASDGVGNILHGNYHIREIIVFENGKYVHKEAVTPVVAEKIAARLNEEEREAFLNEFA